jgi:hypothetical protein
MAPSRIAAKSSSGSAASFNRSQWRCSSVEKLKLSEVSITFDRRGNIINNNNNEAATERENGVY